jgi:hypothetical protein
MEKITLSVDTINAVLFYLSKQPYDQVVSLIAQIQKEATQEKPKEE